MRNPFRKILALCLAVILCLSCAGTAALAETGSSSDVAKAKWTVLVYVCGSNLESAWQCVTSDLQSLQGISPSDEVNFIYETGGSKQWHYGGISADCLTRFRLNGGVIYVQKDVLAVSGLRIAVRDRRVE